MKRWWAGIGLALACAAHAAPIDDLVIAAELNDGRGVLSLLLKGVDPNLPDSRGRKALFVAAKEESLRAIESLLASPLTKVDEANAQGETPLMIAAIRGSLPAVQALVKRGAAVNRPGWTPLHYACSGPDNGVAAFLIAQGADLNARSENGTTPLMMAARYGSEDAQVFMQALTRRLGALARQAGFVTIPCSACTPQAKLLPMPTRPSP